MSLPTTLNPATPAGSESPSLGDDQIRALKQLIIDFLGVPADPTSLTAAAFAISGGGVVTLSQGNMVLQVGSVSAPSFAFVGRLTTGIYSSAAGTLDIAAAGLRAAQFNANASAVNYFTITGQPTGSGAQLSANGSDTNIPAVYQAKGTGGHLFYQDAQQITGIVADSRITTYKHKGANESVLNNTLQNDDHLVHSVDINGVYCVQAMLLAQKANAGSAPDLKAGWTGPAGASFIWGNLANTSFGTNLTISDTGTTALTTAPAVLSFGGILQTAGTAGSIQLQWAQSATDGANAVSVLAASTLALTRIDVP